MSEQHAAIRAIDAKLGLDGFRGQPDLAADQAARSAGGALCWSPGQHGPPQHRLVAGHREPVDKVRASRALGDSLRMGRLWFRNREAATYTLRPCARVASARFSTSGSRGASP